MTTLWALAAILIPWLAGTAIVSALSHASTTRTLRIAAGWFLGQALVMAALFTCLHLTGTGRARIILLFLAFIAAFVVWASRRNKQGRPLLQDRCKITPFGQVMLAIIGLSLATKICLLIAAHSTIPIRSDDAVSIWLFKAKVVATLNHLPLDPKDPYFQAGSNPHYPIFVSLVAAWPPMVAGAWNEHLTTLPWLFYYLNLVLLITGGLQRRLGVTASWIVAYVVGSLPLLVVHVYRPGYADLILACFLVAATCFFISWLSTARLQDFLLAAAFACVTALVKREGPPLAAWCVLVFLIAGRRTIGIAPIRSRAIMGISLFAAVVAVVGLLDFSEHSETLAGLGYHRDVWSAMTRHLFVWNSFGFYFWLAAAAWVLSLFRARNSNREIAVLLPIGWLAYIFSIFLLTPQARFALNDQTPSRLLLQIAPATALILAIAICEPTRIPHSEIRNEATHGSL